MDAIDVQPNKAHRREKKDKGKGKEKQDLRGKNPKAFTSQSGAKQARLARRKVEKDQTRLHVPAVDRTFGGHAQGSSSKSSTLAAAGKDELGPPPVIVAVVGPPGVGKSTIIRSLVRRYTKTTMPDIQGPITVVGGKSRRLTFIECPNDIGAMVDIAKIADLVLLLIDGSFGFEMETFECITALSAHGMPKVIAVLTHLDLIKKAAALKAQKTKLKKRFWTEVYDGAKMFYLSGVINGRYPDREIMNLSRFINVAKFRPLIFRNSHPYFLADRVEDLTPREQVRLNPKGERTVAFYGYLRGLPLRMPTANNPIRVHIPGSGVDALQASKLVPLVDPCPLPTKESEKRRKLGAKDRLFHAPMSGGAGGQVVFDGDRVWINTAGNFTRPTEDEDGVETQATGEGEQMVMELQGVGSTLADNIAQSEIRLFGKSQAPLSVEDQLMSNEGFESEEDSQSGSEADFDSDDDESLIDNLEDGDAGLVSGRHGQKRGALSTMEGEDQSDDEDVAYAESDSDFDQDQTFLTAPDGLSDAAEEEEGESSDEEEPQWKQQLASVAKSNFGRASQRQSKAKNWMRLIYQTDTSPADICGLSKVQHSTEDDLFQLAGNDESAVERESFRQRLPLTSLSNHFDEDGLNRLRRLFITGDAATGANAEGAVDKEYESDGGSFQDMEEDGAEADQEDEETSAFAKDESKADALAIKKAALKKKFDQQYDSSDGEDDQDFFTEQKDDMLKRIAATEAEFADADPATKALVQGYRPGTYIRLELEGVPAELIKNLNPKFPLIIGGLLNHEESFGYVQVRIKKHRWFPKVLKTNDPLVFSIGWRRFQTVPIYSLDDGTRNRMLKYTPDHMHCLATFYGPISAPNTGFCAFNTLSTATAAFKVTATGTVTDVDGAPSIVKKLKLSGVPSQIFKNTAFVKDMFNSSLEVAKFEGAQIRTVSGIRGQIKKALAKPEGNFRATFEDRVLMSDIIFLRAWYSVQPRKFYYPVSSLLLEDKTQWAGMRLTGQVRVDEGIQTANNVNSTYKPVERVTRRFNTLKVPRKLQAALPYASKPKIPKASNGKTYVQKRAVLLEPEERKSLGVLQQISAIDRVKVQKRKDKQSERRQDKRKKNEKGEELKAEREKRETKDHFRNLAIKEKRKAEAQSSRGGKRAKRDG